MPRVSYGASMMTKAPMTCGFNVHPMMHLERIRRLRATFWLTQNLLLIFA